MIFPSDFKLALSRRLHLPIVKGFDAAYSPWGFLQLLWAARTWNIVNMNDEYIILRAGTHRLKMLRNEDKRYHSPSYTQTFFAHYIQWRSDYKSPWPLNGKTVLDAGSGVGETAFSFFQRGAGKVIAVDLNPKACETLRENSMVSAWNVEILNEPFSVGHIQRSDWDFAKIDVEGGEACLLELDKLPSKPIVLETHGDKLTKQLTTRFKDLHLVRKESGYCTIMRNWV